MANKFLNGIAVTGDGTVTGKLSADNFELTSGDHHLTFTESNSDWSILNASQSNGIVIFDGTGGIDFLYDNNIKTTVDTSGLKVFGTSRATGLIVTTSNIIAGEGGGGVALTVNDGYGNANLTFNHVSGVPEQDGNSFRIETNTDSSSSAAMVFEIAEGVSSGVTIQTTEVFRLEPSGPKVRANSGGILSLQRDDTGIVDNNTLGRIRFGGDDPVNNTFNYGAEIRSEAAGSWGTDNYPTELQFYTKFDDTDLLALKLDKNQNTYLSGNLNFAGGNIYNSTGNFIIQNNAGAQFDVKSNQGVRLYIDANGDDTVHKFEILSNTDTYASGNVVASVDQSGNATFASEVNSSAVNSSTVNSSAVNITSDLSAAETIDYPLIISSKDDDNNINQLGGEGVGIQFKIAGNDDTVPGNSFLGASIAAIRESAIDTTSSTGLGFFITQNDETLDEAMHIDSSKKVGIGTSLPTTALQISTAMTSSPSSNIFLDVDGSNTNGGGGSIIFGTSASAGSATSYNAKITGTRASGGDGGDSKLGFWTTLVSDSTSPQQRMTISKEGYVGLNNTNPTSRLHVHHTEDDTDQDLPGSFAMEIDGNFTGTNSITTGNDREQGALYIDVDSSSTGGDTADEHRVYGIYSDTRFNGTADLAASVYAIAEQNTTTDNQSAYVIGVQGLGVTDGGADFLVSNLAGVWGEANMQDATPVTNSYGGYFKNTVAANRTGATTTSYGSYSEVEINSSSSFTNIKGKRIAIDVNTNDFTATSIQGLDIVFTGINNIPRKQTLGLFIQRLIFKVIIKVILV